MSLHLAVLSVGVALVVTIGAGWYFLRALIIGGLRYRIAIYLTKRDRICFEDALELVRQGLYTLSEQEDQVLCDSYWTAIQEDDPSRFGG